jgi:plasmid stability protein
MQCSYNAGMSVAITIRNVPDPVRNELAARAAANGWSLQEFLLSELIRLSERPNNAELIAGARRRLAGPGPTIAQILRERNADRP